MNANNQSKTLDTALSLLSRRGERFADELEKGIEWAIKETSGKKLVEVETAVALTDSEKKEFAARFPEPVFTVKPELLGGFRVTVGDWKLDATLVNELDRMKQVLKESI